MIRTYCDRCGIELCYKTCKGAGYYKISISGVSYERGATIPESNRHLCMKCANELENVLENWLREPHRHILNDWPKND